jgi:hypothetical protein
VADVGHRRETSERKAKPAGATACPHDNAGSLPLLFLDAPTTARGQNSAAMTAPDPTLPDAPAHSPPSGFEPLRFDLHKYEHHLAEFNLTDAQRKELLETLWWMMTCFIDLQFGEKAAFVPQDELDALKEAMRKSGEGRRQR